MSIRWRLTLWFALILCIILIIAGAFFYVAFGRYLTAEVASNLKVYSARAVDALAAEEFPQPIDYAAVQSALPSSADVHFFQLMDSDRNVVVRSESLGENDLPISEEVVDTALKDNNGFAVLSAEGDAGLYIKITTTTLGGQTHFLVVAQSLADTTNTMGRMGFFLLVSILVILILALLSGALLIRRALSPVRRVTATAQSIESSSDLSRRVGYRGPRDEIGQLATTFDRMIERLDSALQAQKNFVADASHELRGPLTVMQGNLDLLKRNLKEEDRRESLRALEAETSRMSKVVSDLLILAELDSGQPERQDAVALRDMLLDAQRRARQLAGNRHIVVGRQEDLRVKGNADKLEQVFSNLVDNAIKYTSDGGTITLSLFRDGDWVCLAVADTGIGVSRQDLPHIFDRFYRVDKARSKASGGTGLGLAIVKGIVERHGGRVTVTSEPGKGSTFTVWLKL
jgi:two-component system OmpR family sensor kinase